MLKTILRNHLFLLLVFKLGTYQLAASQITINANSNNYSVTVFMYPVAVVPSSYSCTWGYNYNIQLSYIVTLSGYNPPASLHTLQGTIGCGPDALFFDLPNAGGTGYTTTTSNAWRPIGDCAVATPLTLSCNNINLQVQGPSMPSRVVSFAVSALPLSVKLTEFSVFSSANNAVLNWETVTETNNDKIIIQKSLDATGWSDIDSIKGAGISVEKKKYQYTDKTLSSGRYFYRLKFVSTDRQISYSETKSIKLNDAKKNTVSAFPIPNQSDLLTVRDIPSEGLTTLMLQNMFGTVLYQTKVTSESIKLPVIPAGVYYLHFVNEQEGLNETIKYIRL